MIDATNASVRAVTNNIISQLRADPDGYAEATADGHISRHQLEVMRQIIAERLNLDALLRCAPMGDDIWNVGVISTAPAI